MKKVLMLSYHFPPEEGSCSDKNVKLLQSLTEAEIGVDVLTVGFHKEEEKYLGAKIYRVPGGFFHKNKNQEQVNNSFIPSGSNRITFKDKLKSFVQRHIIPDPVIDWYFEVKKWSATNSDLLKNYDLIFSISSPYSSHIIARYIYKKYNIQYVCSYGDPWIYEPSRRRGWMRYRIEYNIEKRIVNDAKAISVITDYNKREYARLYHIDDNRIATFNIGYRHSEKKHEIQEPGNLPRLIYGGSLNPVHRNVAPFFEALQKAPVVSVDIYNEDYPEVSNLVLKYNIESNVRIHKLIPAEQFNCELYKSDVLLLFGNKTPFQVPGKLFEYISTGTHIIYIKNNNDEDDGTSIILKKYGNVSVVQNNTAEIIDALYSISIKYNEQQLTPQSDIKDYEFHNTMRPVVEQVQSILNDII